MTRGFSAQIPPSMSRLIEEGHEEIAKQFVVSDEEGLVLSAELEDPIGDRRWNPLPGLTHRYPDRALIHVTQVCAAHCRFCFRRNLLNAEQGPLTAGQFSDIVQYIKGKPSIREVIFSGGDPLTLPTQTLADHFLAFADMSHIRTLRIHTRMPCLTPERIDSDLVTALAGLPHPLWVVVHVNTAAELTLPARAVLRDLAEAGIGLRAQSVLLKGVNDTHAALLALFRTLHELRVAPYYLHYPDLVQGTQHFRVPLERAIELLDTLWGRLPGAAIPRLIVDIPGGSGKIPVPSANAKFLEPGYWEFRSPLDSSLTRVRYTR